jgi:hypothetical protein
MNLGFLTIGAAILLAGAVIVGFAMRRRGLNEPGSTAILIAGWMITVFGLMLVAFAIVYDLTGPAEGMAS